MKTQRVITSECILCSSVKHICVSLPLKMLLRYTTIKREWFLFSPEKGKYQHSLTVACFIAMSKPSRNRNSAPLHCTGGEIRDSGARTEMTLTLDIMRTFPCEDSPGRGDSYSSTEVCSLDLMEVFRTKLPWLSPAWSQM